MIRDSVFEVSQIFSGTQAFDFAKKKNFKFCFDIGLDYRRGFLTLTVV